MRRKRGRAKSSASNPDPETNGIMSTSMETGQRRSKRTSSNAPVSRLRPTTPLHMTTRKAASQAATNSTANSEASTDSRRSSLANSTAHVGGFDIDFDSGRPAKRKRQLSGSHDSTNERSSFNPSLDGKPTTRRVQHEGSLDVPLLSIDDENVNNGALSVELSENGDTIPIRDRIDEDADVIRDLKPIAPVVRRRGRGRRPKTVAQNLAVESGNESIGQTTPARSASRLNGNGMDSDQDRATRVIKRLPGRRRAPNPNLSIEADLRRQLHLKMGYRAVAKALKPVLAELSKRSIDELLTNEEYHKENEAYEEVIAQLDKRLQHKLQLLENEKRILTEFHERSQRAHSEYFEQRFEDYVFALQDDYITIGKHALLNLIREQDEDANSDATEDEGGIVADEGDVIPHTLLKYGVVQPLHNSVSLHQSTGRLDSRFDSRSRVFMETDRLWEQSRDRWRVRATILKAAENEPEELEVLHQHIDGLGTTDYARRSRAIARLNVQALAEAAEEVEDQAKKGQERPKVKVISNEDAEGLQALVYGLEMQTAQAQLQEQPQPPIQALPPTLIEALQPLWYQIPAPGPPITQLRPLERSIQEALPGATYYDLTRSLLPSREDNLRYVDAEMTEPKQAPKADRTVELEMNTLRNSREDPLATRKQSYDAGQPQFYPEFGATERKTHEFHTPTPPKFVAPYNQHSRTSSLEERASRERSNSFRRHTSPDGGHDQYAQYIKNETSRTPVNLERLPPHPSVQPAGPYQTMPSLESIPEYQRLGAVALPGSASAQPAPSPSHAPDIPTATPASAQGSIPPSFQPEPSYRQASDNLHWRSDSDRHEANKARLSHLRPNRPMTIEEEIAALRERHAPHHMRDRKSSGEGRSRAETIGEPQQSKRPSLALDTAAGSESRSGGPSTAPAHQASPLATPIQSAGTRPMSPFPLLQRRPPPPDGRRESPPVHGHSHRSLSLGGVPLEPPNVPYHSYGPPPVHSAYSSYGPPPPLPSYDPHPQSHYNASTYSPAPPPTLQPTPGYHSQPPTPSQKSAPPQGHQLLQQQPPLFQPILPNNPPNTIMTPTYSGPQYRGTPIQPANLPPASGAVTAAPPFGPAFSQIGSNGGDGARPGSGAAGGRGGRPRGRGIRTGETVFSHYQGPPGERDKNGRGRGDGGRGETRGEGV